MAERSPLMMGAAVIFMIFMVCILAGCINPQTTGSTVPATKAPRPLNTATFPTPHRITTVPTLSEGTDIKMQENDFEPYSLVVMNGTTVTWTNEDETRNCSVVSDDGTPVSFQSGTLTKGGTFKFRFTRPGTYPYHSGIPPEIQGEIVVL